MLVCGCVTIDSENTCTAPNMFFGARNELSQFENVKTSFGVSSVGSLEAPMCLGLGFFGVFLTLSPNSNPTIFSRKVTRG